jgi:predicted chitinase
MAIDRETQVLTDATAAGITNPRELANFMAQVTHESNGLSRLEESFRYTRNISQIPVQSAWREGPDALDAARKQALMGKPEQLAELMYGGRNGNDTTQMDQEINYLFTGKEDQSTSSAIDKNLAYTQLALSTIDSVKIIPTDPEMLEKKSHSAFVATIGSASPPMAAMFFQGTLGSALMYSVFNPGNGRPGPQGQPAGSMGSAHHQPGSQEAASGGRSAQTFHRVTGQSTAPQGDEIKRM